MLIDLNAIDNWKGERDHFTEFFLKKITNNQRDSANAYSALTVQKDKIYFTSWPKCNKRHVEIRMHYKCSIISNIGLIEKNTP